MTNRIEGWCIIDTQTGERILKVYETRGGAKTSFNSSFYKNGRTFDKQERYILNALVVLEGKDEE